ncbi:P-loop containing nucleoside triphosphate hydrolases superfamily protein [Perilla frutescens var. hirtella]|uniref:P-loop containing nucleoside triphosphate hydrolases superfamily protein n=1 Tax=Perilla frutescens var. hirtella TaxID=608512 RepID=A0AAD4P3V3_PERFH|nr:P-loop containing nucleoside triphosphate hydrolases superfamily protein [Perilla frutescens var. hirtella]
MEQEMLSLLSDGRDSSVTFDKFPYYLSEQTRVLLTSAAFVHLKKGDFSKHTRNLGPASRTILLSGPAELYQQMLAKALAHYFEAKLLLLDVNDFSLKMLSKHGGPNTAPSFKRSVSETTLSRMSDIFGSLSLLQQKEDIKGNLRRQSSGFDLKSNAQESLNPAKLRRNASAAANIDSLGSTSTPAKSAPLKRTSSWCFDDKLFIQTLYKVLVKISKVCPVVLYLRDVEKLLCRSQRSYILFQKMLKQLSGSVLILGSRIVNPENDYQAVDERVSSVFSYNIEIKPPEEKNYLVSWNSQLEEDMRMIQFKDNKNHIVEVLAANDIDCDDLDSICMADTMVLSDYIEEIVVSAISYHLMNTTEPEYRNGKLVISSKSLSHGLSIFPKGKSAGINALKVEPQTEMPKAEAKTETKAEAKAETKAEAKAETKAETAGPESKKDDPPVPKTPEVPPDNEFEKRIRPEVIPANEIGVTFADIGALDEIKESLQELVMLPLRRPDLFEGGLLKPCRGILLFGPPGTGKTMLAKAIANEAGASFINVSMSTITSKWFGEDEKNVRALFTLAAKVSPTIVFVDEVDSMLGQRNRAGEHEAMRKIKNEFMTHWDGLLTKPGERILVLAATNRPFDLDEAIIRRFERRIMVSLPSVENREKILRTLLSKEKVDEGLDFLELATQTEGYSGSDLKNLCITAAYRPVRELIKQERLKDQEKKHRSEEGKQCRDISDKECKEERVITIRPLNMEDFREAKKQVAASFAAEGSIMAELKQWNEAYGEGGSRKKEQLSYFL